MTRKVRIRIVTSGAARPVPQEPSPSPSIDLSDESGYSAVEDVSDDQDDEEEDVVAAEEKHMITNERRRGRSSRSPRPHSSSSDEEAAEGDADDEDEEDEEGMQPYNLHDEEDDVDSISFQYEEDSEDHEGHGLDSPAGWNGFGDDDDDGDAGNDTHLALEPALSEQRHVRFAGVPTDSDSADSDEEDMLADDDFFPDIFVDKRQLDPAFRREIEYDNGSRFASNLYGNESDLDLSEDSVADMTPNCFSTSHVGFTDTAFQALHNSGLAPPTPITPGPATWCSADPIPTRLMTWDASAPTGHRLLASYGGPDLEESDEYGSQDGETTDDDIPPPADLKGEAPLPRARSETTPSPGSQCDATPVRETPRTGTFTLSRTDKPVVVANPVSRRLMIFTPAGCGTHLPPDLVLAFHRRKSATIRTRTVDSPFRAGSENFTLVPDVTQDHLAALAGAPVTRFNLQEDGYLGSYRDDYSGSSVENDVEEEEDDTERYLNVEDFIVWTGGHPVDLSDGEAPDPIPPPDESAEPIPPAVPAEPTESAEYAGFPQPAEPAETAAFAETAWPVWPTWPDESDDLLWPTGFAEQAALAEPAGSAEPTQPDPGSIEPDGAIDMLPHLNPHTVGAFRQNQINQQLLLSTNATPDSLAFSTPYNSTALRGIKAGRIATASEPLAPGRKVRRQQQQQPRLPAPPPHILAETSPAVASRKRGAPSAPVQFELTPGHKRQRLIPGLSQTLA